MSGAPKPAEIPYFRHHAPRISTTPNSSRYKHSTAEQRGRRFSKWNVAPLFVPGESKPKRRTREPIPMCQGVKCQQVPWASITTQIRTAKRNVSWRSSAPHVSTRNNTPGGPKKTHSTPTQSIAERPVTYSGRLQVSREANIGELSELSTGSSSQLSPTCWVPHTDTEPILPKKPKSASWLLRSTGTTPKTCSRNGTATRKIRKSQRVRPRPRMTAQDIAEALYDVEALLGKLESIMSD